MTAQPRERACACQVCRADTWAVSAVCDGCREPSEGSAETLRRAAALMRERAETATPGRWTNDRGRVIPADAEPMILTPDKRRSLGIIRSVLDSEHIAGMDPTVALAVADWLDFEARTREATNSNQQTVRALAVARAFLGESP